MIYNLSSYHKHLGDELQFSWMPEVLHKLGYKVNLYAGKDVLPFSNEGIKKFVWDHNPYIKASEPVDNDWNIGDIPGVKYENTTGAFLTNWARAFGLPETETLPKIYYKPVEVDWGHIKPVDGVIELSGISMKNEYKRDAVITAIQRIVKQYPKINFHVLKTDHQANPIHIDGFGSVSCHSLEDVSNLIYSCKVFISLSSGLHSLAAAIQRYNQNLSQYCILPASKWDFFMNTKLFIYPNIIYIQEG